MVAEVNIDVALVAWPNHPRRWHALQETVASLKRYLTATGHSLRYVCSSESTRDSRHHWYGEDLRKLCMANSITFKFRGGPPGLGENMNAALRLCEGEYILLVQDDRPLLKPLDLAPSIAFMERNRTVDLIRYGWPQGRHMPTGSYRSKLMTHPDGWRRFNLAGAWPYGDEPHLRRRSFMEQYGWYREGIRHGGSEGIMLRDLQRLGATIVAADDIYFGHNCADVSAVIEDTRVQGRNRDV